MLKPILMLGVVLAPLAVSAEPRLLIPQVEGERQGGVVGRAIACGAPRERAEAVLRAARERMLAAVGRAFTQDRYLPALDRALSFEAGLLRPSAAACAKAMADLDRMAAGG